MWVDSDGALMRPVQDCSTIYGGSIRLQRVVALDEARFEEVDLGPLSTPNELAESRFHTYNSEESLQVVDVLRRLPRGRSQAAAEVDHGAAQ